MRQRRQYLILRSFQLKYVRMVMVPLVSIVLALYYLIYFMMMRQMAIPEIIAYNLVPALRKVNVIIALIAPVVLLGLFSWIIVTTHKIAGPLYRVQQELARVADGDFSVRIRFRKGDELASLADSLNLVLERAEQGEHS